MKKKYIVFLLMCITINLILIAVIAFLKADNFKNFFSITGTVGDTIGGISNLILGTLSIYLIYITYSNQRKANYSLISTSIYNNIVEQIKHSRAELDKLTYSINYNVSVGVEAVEQFELSLFSIIQGIGGMGDVYSEKRKIYQDTSVYDHKILLNSLDFLRSILFIVEKIENEHLTALDKESALWFTKDLFNYYNNNYIKVINLIKGSIMYAPFDKESYNSTDETIQINYFIDQIAIFDGFINRLIHHKVVSIVDDETVTVDYFFTKQEINTEKLKGIKSYSIKIINP